MQLDIGVYERYSMRRSANTEAVTYRIRVQGILDHQTASAMDLSIDTQTATDAPPITTLTGALPDEAALDHLLDKLYTLGLPLISVEREEANQATSTGTPASREVDEPDQFT
jgi:hypothetical protein